MLSNIVGLLQRTPIYAEEVVKSLGRFFRHIPAFSFTFAAELSDFFIVQGAALVANSVIQKGNGEAILSIFGANIIAFACFFSFQHGKIYELISLKNENRVLGRIFVRWSVLCSCLIVSAIVLHHTGSRVRIWIAIFYCSGWAGFCINRAIISVCIKRWLAYGNHIRKVGIVGRGETAHQLVDFLKFPSSGLSVVGFFTNDHHGDGNADYDIKKLLQLAEADAVDTVIVADPTLTAEHLRRLVRELRQQPLSIYLLPSSISLDTYKIFQKQYDDIFGLGLFSILDRPIDKASLFIKGVFDRLAALLLLILFCPIFILCAFGIYFSNPGPIFFYQNRIGYKGREFRIVKFRTMYVTKLPNDRLTVRNDPRVFKFGMIMRKLSLDELPQLLNVLRGEMSLVGPRPHMRQATAAGQLYFNAVSDYAARHRVKPGLTGWAQVNGWRGPTETIQQIEARVAHDLFYIDNWSLALDLSILFRTFFVLFGKEVF